GFTNAYFYTAPDGGQVFMDPATGVAFSGSVHPRSEMRESTPDDNGAMWASSGTNTMTVTGKVTLLSGGNKGSATIAQVFVADSNTLCELQYTGSGMKLFYEESKGNGETPVDLKTSIPMNTKYTFAIGYSKGLLTVKLNGTQVYSRTPSSAVSGKKFFFKFGNYDQTANPGTPNTTPYTQVEVYSVDIVHS
ncbi:MAG TPA: polysaccharide lyase family 7 protein, partial [Polyangiaceae bacterium]